MTDALGVDLGGVIFDYASSYKPGEFTRKDFLAVPVMEGSIKALSFLNKERFKNSIYLVSKYYTEEDRVLMHEWLDNNNFFTRTKISKDHLYQCAERHEKAPIVKELGITHFVDDRAEVMSHFAGFVPNLYHFQSLLEDRDEWSSRVPNLVFVESWEELLPMLVI